VSDPTTLARSARESLAKGLNALQSDPNVPPQLVELGAPIAQAMGALHQIERSQGAQLMPHAEVALNNVRTALSQLQAPPNPHPAVIAAMEAVAASLGMVHALSKMATGPAAAPPQAQPPAAPQAPVAQPPAQQPHFPAPGNGAPQQFHPQPVAQPPQQPPQPVAQHAPQQPPPQQFQPQPVVQPPQQPPQPVAQHAPQQPPPQQFQPQPVAQPPQPAFQPPQQPPPQQPPPQQFQPQPPQQFQPQPQGQQPPPGFVPQGQPMQFQPTMQQPPQPFGGQPPQAAPARPSQGGVDPFAARPSGPQPGAPAPAPAPAGYRAPDNGAPIDAALGAHSATNFYKGLAGNDIIDHGGLFIATYMIPKLGSTVRLRVSLPGGYEFEANAIVKWSRESTDPFGDSQPGFGAQFTQISPEARQLVYRYVRNREPLFHDDL
jgi:hypothetical protein